MSEWQFGKKLENHYDTFYYDETLDGRLRILITVESHVPWEIGEVIFSEETEDYRNILEFRSPKRGDDDEIIPPWEKRQYYGQNKINLKSRPLLPIEIAHHENMFKQALENHPYKEVLLKCYMGDIHSKAYYEELKKREIIANFLNKDTHFFPSNN